MRIHVHFIAVIELGHAFLVVVLGNYATFLCILPTDNVVAVYALHTGVLADSFYVSPELTEILKPIGIASLVRAIQRHSGTGGHVLCDISVIEYGHLLFWRLRR